jgi:Tfp pilus assembly protein PilX
MNRYKQKNGSVLILVLVGTLIISLLGILALDQTATEVAISSNFVADKTALFAAETGIQTGINKLRNTVDPLTEKVDMTDSGSHMSQAYKSA